MQSLSNEQLSDLIRQAVQLQKQHLNTARQTQGKTLSEDRPSKTPVPTNPGDNNEAPESAKNAVAKADTDNSNSAPSDVVDKNHIPNKHDCY